MIFKFISGFTLSVFKKVQLTFLLLFFLCISFAQTKSKVITTKQEKYIKVNHANRLLFDKTSGNEAQRLIGAVECEHDGAKMFCDSAYLYNNKKLDAFGHISIIKGDSIFVYGDSLSYDANTKLANLKGNVRCIEKDMILTTTILVYDMAKSVASYYNGGVIVNKENTLTSKNGHYYSASKDLSFHYDVVLTNPDYKMRSDTLRYNTVNKTAYFIGPTIITSKENYIYCENGWYDTDKEISRFSKNALINSKDQKLYGDSIFYDRKKGYGRVIKNIRIIDTTNKSIITGNFAEHFEKTNRSIVSGRAIYGKRIENDTLFLCADTLNYNKPDSLHSFIKAFRNVKIYKSDLQGICDSLGYSLHDSLLKLYNSPVLWTNNGQVTAKQINVTAGERGVSFFELNNNAVLIQKSDSLDENKFNQISGKRIEGFFANDTIRKLNVNGNAQIIYYVKQKGKYTGVNKTICSNLSVWFNSDGVNKATFRNKPESIVYPLIEIDDKEMRIKNFVWLENKRPKNKADLLLGKK
jgi:lipopolysaccharide export system protein LptA